MAIFLTGSTGYLGSYLAAGIFAGHRDSLNLLVRAKSEQEARERLWQSLQLHFDFPEFRDYLATRVRIFRGDLTSERFGLSADDYERLVQTTDSLLHCAASLNRKSEKQCLNVNLRGSLEVIQLARRIQDHHGLRRYSHVSTVAVAGTRQDEVGLADLSRTDRRASQRRRLAQASVCLFAWSAVLRHRQLAGPKKERSGPRRVSSQGLLALPDLEYRVRQFASG